MINHSIKFDCITINIYNHGNFRFAKRRYEII